MEAAAATAVIMDVKSMISENIVEFTANRPFIHLITHKPSGTILFMGRLSSPTDEMEWTTCSVTDSDCPNPVYNLELRRANSASCTKPLAYITLFVMSLLNVLNY